MNHINYSKKIRKITDNNYVKDSRGIISDISIFSLFSCGLVSSYLARILEAICIVEEIFELCSNP